MDIVKRTPEEVYGDKYSVEGTELRIDIAGSGFEFGMNELDPQNGDVAWVLYVFSEVLYKGMADVGSTLDPTNASMSKESLQGTGVDTFDQSYRTRVKLKLNPFQAFLAPDTEG